MRASSFAGTPDTAALWNPYIAPGHLLPRFFGGVPLGPDLRTGQLVVFDPWQLQQLRVIHSTIINVFGEKDGGKTTLLRTLFVRLMRLQAGLRSGEPVPMRGRIHSRKQEGDTEGEEESEYKALSDCMQSEVFAPAAHGSVNIFDPRMGMTYSDLLETAINVCELASDQPVTGLEPLALQVGVWKMQRGFPKLTSPEILEVVMRSLASDDRRGYYDATNGALLDNFATELREDPEMAVQLKAVMVEPTHTNEVEFLDAATRVASYLGQITHGAMGTIFTGNGSFYDIMSREMTTIEWDGVTGKTRSLLESMLWKWMIRNPGLRPHLNLQDEVGTSLDSLMQARFMYAWVKKARAYETCDISGTQYRFDITRKGPENSELRGLAQGIMIGSGLQIYTRQPEDDDVLNDLSKQGISDLDLVFMTRLDVGCFGIKAANRPIQFFRLELTPQDWLYNQGNAASKRMTTRRPVWDDASFVERANKLGINRIGMEGVEGVQP